VGFYIYFFITAAVFENDEILLSQSSKGTRISCFKQLHAPIGRENNGIFSIVSKKITGRINCLKICLFTNPAFTYLAFHLPPNTCPLKARETPFNVRDFTVNVTLLTYPFVTYKKQDLDIMKFGGFQLRPYILPIGAVLKKVTNRMRKRQLAYDFVNKEGLHIQRENICKVRKMKRVPQLHVRTR
jgi:hypothetical protein